MSDVIVMLKAEREATQKRLSALDQAIAALSGDEASNVVVPAGKQPMSAASRKKIAAAQKKRWAKFHANKKK